MEEKRAALDFAVAAMLTVEKTKSSNHIKVNCMMQTLLMQKMILELDMIMASMRMTRRALLMASNDRACGIPRPQVGTTLDESTTDCPVEQNLGKFERANKITYINIKTIIGDHL